MCSHGHLIGTGTEARNPGLLYLELTYPAGQLGLAMEVGTDLGKSAHLPFGISVALGKKFNLLKPVSSPVICTE